MDFDPPTRARIQRMTIACRNLLTVEFEEQLQELFGIFPADGRVAPVETLTQRDDQTLAVANLLRRRIGHWSAQERCADQTAPLAGAVQKLLREQAFSVFNRFIALRMAEEQGSIPQPGGGGFSSKGLGTFLDRSNPWALLLPREQALRAVLDELNSPEIQPLWKEDETLGWINECYNGAGGRKKMSEGAVAPRDAIEFVIDNTLGRIWHEMTQGETRLKEQCRHLVLGSDEVFLDRAWFGDAIAAHRWLQTGEGNRPDLVGLAHTVNGYYRAGTAGEQSNRWVEVRLPRLKPDSIPTLSTQELLDLLFLFCRKERFCEGTIDCLRNEIDLILKVLDERMSRSRRTDLSPRELLRQPVFINYRPLKDPRHIRLLDPACGSMPFGPYAFDLFTVIYNEAWDIAHGPRADWEPATFSSFVAFTATFPDKAAFLREVPRLIIEHNIHGIDIDPHAAQIAGLRLWLRAQRAWREAGVEPVGTRPNIVCAEPAPGEKEWLREFVEQQFLSGERAALAFLLETIFERMTLAGNAGSLLRIEEDIDAAIAEAKRLWSEDFKAGQGYPLAEPGQKVSEGEAAMDLTGLTDQEFWDWAEWRICDALLTYAAQAAEAGAFERRSFANDVLQGFAFVKICRKRYDVVVMNPPSGEPADLLKSYLTIRHLAFKDYLTCAFVERSYELCPAGKIGLISARTSVKDQDDANHLREFLLESANIEASADFGSPILDEAQVETTAVALSKR